MPITIANMTHLCVYHNCSHDDAGALLQQCACARATNICVFVYLYTNIYANMRRHKRSPRTICMHTCFQYIRMCRYIHQYICNDTGALPACIYAYVRTTKYICMYMYTNIPISMRRYRCTDTYPSPNDALLTPKETYSTPKDTHVTPKVYVYIYTNIYATKQALRNRSYTKRHLHYIKRLISFTNRHPCYTKRDLSYKKRHPRYIKRDPSKTHLTLVKDMSRSACVVAYMLVYIYTYTFGVTWVSFGVKRPILHITSKETHLTQKYMYRYIPIYMHRHRRFDTFSSPKDTHDTPKETYVTPKDRLLTQKETH